MSSQCLYRPNRLVHIKLEGPKNIPGHLQLPSSRDQPIILPTHKHDLKRPKASQSLKRTESGNCDARCRVAYEGSYKPLVKRGKQSVHQSSETRFKAWDGNGPFYLSLINQDNVTKTGNNNNNRAKRVISGRRLQQLINITSLTSDSEDSADGNVSKKKKNTAQSTSKTKPSKTEKKEDGYTPDSRAFLNSLERHRIDLTMAKLKICEEDDMMSDTDVSDHNPPPAVDPLPLANSRRERQNQERWASHSRLAPHPPAQKLNARMPAQDSPNTETQHKVSVTSRRSGVWDAILRRRNPNHKNTALVIKRTKAATSSRVMATQNVGQKLLDYATPKMDCKVSGRAMKVQESGDGSSAETREPEPNKERLDQQKIKCGCNQAAQHAGGENKVCDEVDQVNTSSSTRDKSLQQEKQSSPRKGRSLGQRNGSFQGMKKSHPQGSPPEVIYPPYFQLERGESGRKRRLKSALNEPKDQRKTVNHRKACRTACQFWQSLVDDDKSSEKEEDKTGETKKNAATNACRSTGDNKSDRRANSVLFPDSCYNNTAIDAQSLTEEVDHTEVASPEVTHSCQVKGYEILRRLRRGKFRENIGLFLASNESNPKFSPVEITVVSLPSMSFAQSFLEAWFTENSASRRRQGFACRQVASNLLPAHTNLLTRLHVFTAGSCVYQVSSHCSWPTLASLLQPSTPESPPTVRSHSCSPTRKYPYHGTPSPERHVHSFESHAHCSIARHASPDAARLKHRGRKQVGFQGFDGFGEIPVVGFHIDGKFQEKICPSQTGAVKLEESAARVIFRQICEGLSHLHDHGLLHSDLNCSNVLVTDKLQVKLTGYGPCCLHTPWESSPGESCDPPLADPYDVYIPPEIMARRSYRGWAKSSDIWCLGMTLLHMTLGEVSQQVNCAVRLRRSKQFKTLCLEHFGYQLGLLLQTLLQLRPLDRPCVDAVLEHAWLSDGTDLAAEIDKHAQQVSMRTDGRTFPLPKRIRQAFSGPGADQTWPEGGQKPDFLAPSQWSCGEECDHDDGSGDHTNQTDEDKHSAHTHTGRPDRGRKQFKQRDTDDSSSIHSSCPNSEIETCSARKEIGTEDSTLRDTKDDTFVDKQRDTDASSSMNSCCQDNETETFSTLKEQNIKASTPKGAKNVPFVDKQRDIQVSSSRHSCCHYPDGETETHSVYKEVEDEEKFSTLRDAKDDILVAQTQSQQSDATMLQASQIQSDHSQTECVSLVSQDISEALK
ncbi:serine/threonine-protein kinase Nek1 [Elysia marginata]|uniref:Serine/threonine-protein kinase Nek1 n=1 Tax=Elysia marginata TaxID=1093978 RepID=A0AAV4FFK2_9GAST|nr:serine/threonine-protein kinase Nek1 [Elysia marginata]